MANIGTLTADLQLQSAAFIRDMGKAQAAVATNTFQINRRMQEMQRHFREVERTAARFNRLMGTLGVGASAAGLATFAKTVFNTVANLGEMADALGVSTEAFQVYQFIAAQTNVSQQNLQTGFAALNRTIGEAAKGSDTAIATFRRLGVGILDAAGKLRPTEAILTDVARALVGIEDPAIRAQMAQELFGDRAGSKMIPMLAELAKGYDANAAAAKRMGAVIQDDVIVRFDQLSDAMARASKVGTVWAADVLDKGITRLETMADWLKLIPGLMSRIPGMGSDPKVLFNGKPLIGGKDVVFPDWQESTFWPQPPAAPAPALLPQSKAMTDAMMADAAAQAAAQDKAREAASRRAQQIIEADSKRNRSLSDYIAGLEDAARLERLQGVEKERIRAVMEAQAKLVDENGIALRELTELERERIVQAVNVRDAILKQREALEYVANVADRVFDRVGQSVTDMFVQGKAAAVDFRNVALGVVSELAQELFKLAAINPLKNLLFGSNAPTLTSLGGIVGSLFGGGGSSWTNSLGGVSSFISSPMGFAEGGRPPVGVASIVGEKGPELFVPDVPGTIVPNANIAGAMNRVGPSGSEDGGNTYVFNMPGADMGAVKELERFVMAELGPGKIEKRAVSGVVAERQRNPRLFNIGR